MPGGQNRPDRRHREDVPAEIGVRPVQRHLAQLVDGDAVRAVEVRESVVLITRPRRIEQIVPERARGVGNPVDLRARAVHEHRAGASRTRGTPQAAQIDPSSSAVVPWRLRQPSPPWAAS